MRLVLFMDDTGNSEDEVHLADNYHSLNDTMLDDDEDGVDAAISSCKWGHRD